MTNGCLCCTICGDLTGIWGAICTPGGRRGELAFDRLRSKPLVGADPTPIHPDIFASDALIQGLSADG